MSSRVDAAGRQASIGELLAILVPPLGDAVIVFGLSALLMRLPGGRRRWTIVLLCVANLSALRGDAIWTYLCVNASANQLQDPTFAKTVASAVENLRFPAEKLVVELTESALMDNQDKALHTLERLRELGVQIAIDDSAPAILHCIIPDAFRSTR